MTYYNTKKLTSHEELMQTLAELAQDTDSHGLDCAVCLRGDLYLVTGTGGAVGRACDRDGFAPIACFVVSSDVKDMYDIIADGGADYDESVQNDCAGDLTPEQWAILGLG